IRVEEELKHQRELIQQGFDLTNKRFEEMLVNSNKRFEQVDKRFEQVDKRFEQIDKRFEEMRIYSDKRFEQVDKRLEDMRINSDKRFEQTDKHFEQLEKHLALISNRMDRFMFWSLGLTISAVITIINLT
ncbi:MAG: hypothetical protein Q7U57_05960, partial [Methylovulum sp.]|nr:hypothetical protein [Methylovulum sp.]